MKKCFYLVFSALMLLLAGCEESGDNAGSRFETPTIAAVNGTNVRISCRMPGGEKLLQQGVPGVAYGVVGSPRVTFKTTTDGCKVLGDCIVAEISGLDPETRYQCYVFLANERGIRYIESGLQSFTSGAGSGGDTPTPTPPPTPTPDDTTPVFGTPTCTNVTSTSATLSCAYTYTGQGTISAATLHLQAAGAAERTLNITPISSPLTTTLTDLTASTSYTAWWGLTLNGKEYLGTKVTFTTEAEQGGGSTETYRSGWPELPIEREESGLYYASHICPDFSVGGHLARNYTVCYSGEHHCPVWCAAPRHACYESGVSRTDAYGTDPVIPTSIQYNSKSTGGGCNKGHMIGSAERLATRKTNEQVFYYTNIAPQLSDSFNTGGGAWNNLEDYVDGLVCADTTYVVVGTYFKTFTDSYGQSCSPATISFGGRDDVTRPSMFYYLVLRTKKGNTKKSVYDCSASELQCAAFVLRHNMEKGHKPSRQDMRSIAEMEQLTGFTFFANVKNAPKTTYDPSDWGL